MRTRSFRAREGLLIDSAAQRIGLQASARLAARNNRCVTAAVNREVGRDSRS
jgi:hypothetical protein